MIIFSTSGDFTKTTNYLQEMKHKKFLNAVITQAQNGVNALEQYTPKDTGRTASSWYSEIEESPDKLIVYWKNSNVQDGFPVAIGLQFGHGTGTGGYVQGQDYINPALRPVFDDIERAIREEVRVRNG